MNKATIKDINSNKKYFSLLLNLGAPMAFDGSMVLYNRIFCERWTIQVNALADRMEWSAHNKKDKPVVDIRDDFVMSVVVMDRKDIVNTHECFIVE